MKNLRRRFELFCMRHRDFGIPNLMLWIAIGNILIYILSLIDPSNVVHNLLSFSRYAILHGQVWRLFTYILIPESTRLLFFAIMLVFYIQIGRFMEAQWGRLKFNLFYGCGILIMDLGALLLNCTASVSYLNISLILSFATLIPESRVMLFFIIPLKMKYLAWFYFALTAFEVIFMPFPYNLFPLFALLNYFLFFGSDVLQVLPDQLRNARFRRSTEQRRAARPNPDWASRYRSSSSASHEKPYRHKCTVCGRTDTDYPGIEFRYCSLCKGYHCYCMEHINNHEHIQS